MQIKLASVTVDDQDKALHFYTAVLGFVKKNDIPMGEFRWLTVSSDDRLAPAPGYPGPSPACPPRILSPTTDFTRADTVLAEDLGLQPAGELLLFQQFVAQPAVERLGVAVLPKRPGLDVAG